MSDKYVFDRELHQRRFNELNFPDWVSKQLEDTVVIVPGSLEELEPLIMGAPEELAKELGIPKTDRNNGSGRFTIGYKIGRKFVPEMEVTEHENAYNGVSCDPKMRKRQPSALQVMDDLPTDKPCLKDTYEVDPEKVKRDTIKWLSKRVLLAVPFQISIREIDQAGVMLMPLNAAFNAFGGGNLQEFLPVDTFEDFSPSLYFYTAPAFRHTLFSGNQVVGIDREDEPLSMWSYTLYPGPGFKKGLFGYLIHIADLEDYEILHAAGTIVRNHESGNQTFFVHMGPSGGGKTESGMSPIIGEDGRMLLARQINGEAEYRLQMPRSLELWPVADDMMVAHPSFQKDDLCYYLGDGEHGWFIRTDGILGYGDDSRVEKIILRNQNGNLYVLNFGGIPGAPIQPWTPYMEEVDGELKPCANPRVVIPRCQIPGIVNGPQAVDILSWGLRQPPLMKDRISYGVFGLAHLMLPAQMLLHMLVALRGYANPSIDAGDADTDMVAELAGSSYPFSSGTLVNGANMTGRIVEKASHKARMVLCPNQYSGAYEMGFGGLWAMREWLTARSKAPIDFNAHIREGRHPLLGYVFREIYIGAYQIPDHLLKVHRQGEVGHDAYDKGVKVMVDFYKDILKDYLSEGLDPQVKKVLEAFIGDASYEDMANLYETRFQPWQ